ncbi:glycosyl transferase family 2 [Desulfofarcimen acetoxidans DSM 771]|uniref:Glycosyl transferase family 2 n=1 Tax=Desulfofarcimen acetoxidans (strain ATCC 49208 / DSM 771 / KCTC 5769 / VKM B-1644 / 5575) TaxID=485916 RepID=C8VYU0_DESAS|nr:glycosyltransferase family 2 protein [Desulfofarcimen acetoxidans]ACV64811.1 glycosyl transferase family 2 [Desulfofarcimen acetoxidans DSM 771]
MLRKDIINPNVSLIIVTYNAEKFIADCLLSVNKQNYTCFETIVVDNASNDNTVNLIKTGFSWARLVESQQNLGFTGGVHLGYSIAKGKYIALLNPDTRADKEWLGNLLTVMERDDECGICASLMLKWGTQLIDTAGDGCTRAGKGFKIGNDQPAKFYQETREVFAACGGAVLYRRKMIEEIGFFDNSFFLLHEDTDLCFRARLAGWKCMYVHNAMVEHKVSSSIGYKTPLAVYHSVKNSDMVWLKNMPGHFLFLTIPEKVISDLASLIYLGIIHHRLKDYLKAKWYIVRNLKNIITARSEMQKKINKHGKLVFQQLTPFLSNKFIISLWKSKYKELRYFLNLPRG